jgi:hypothetical protein
MTISIQQVKDDLRGVVHGTTVDKITNLYGLFNRAAGEVLLDVDLQETRRTVNIGQVFKSVYDYAAPSDLKGNRIIDIRPQANRKGETWPQRFNQWFDKKKWLENQNQFTITHNTGVKSLRIDAPFLTAPAIISSTGSLTGWSAVDGADSLVLDTKFSAAGAGALQFYLDGLMEGRILNSTLNPIDLSEHEGVAKIFFWVYTPTAMTGVGNDIVTIRWGSDPADYWENTTDTQHDGTAFKSGWNLVSIDWPASATSGSPDSSAISFVQVSLFPTVEMVGAKICNIVSILGQFLEAEYYSRYFFRTPANVFKEKVEDDATDLDTLLNVDTESYPVYFEKLTELIFRQLQGDDAKNEAKEYAQKYRAVLMRYKNLYPSEVQYTQESYYEPTKGNYDGFVPRIWSP